MGNTPLVGLERLFPELDVKIFAKLERFNPGGSIKDRTALNMLIGKIRRGELTRGRSLVVESSSGNLAIGLAQVCRYHGLRFLCVVDAKTTRQNIGILRAFGAQVEIVDERDPQTDEYLPVRLRRVREIVAADPNAYWPNQYVNPLNPEAHAATMREVVEALDGRVDYLFCSVSTFGTLRGCAEYLRARGHDTTVVAVDAAGSAIFGRESRPRLITGHGASLPPQLLDAELADEVVHVTDLECVVACRRLVLREAILAGGSSGATVAALEKLGAALPAGANCALIFPDGGDRYLDTVYSDAWVTRHFGEVAHLWKEPASAGGAGGTAPE
ncbi:2,3-diaminopropionate biosynthesis protein SbnA [Actinomadura algeriensis]|uniref:N-(2-amino-2-carboxyethyl)-L-glutamate synthase n=1 Tax=Actinomadura algeriensis TaxID=1679523 RepID=A0ABR9JU18_9ACTN|nr:2,3-diaminopropionate biosynthesis protein SbnA [Actinomadura algeriensis]MBE1533898.1 cysteine synthase A [Actinomadura algeriensis]